MRHFFILIFCFYSCAILSKDVNLNKRGVVGDGLTDNWQIIQKAIDDVAISGGGTVYFPKGTFAIYDKSLIVWGENVKLVGVDYRNSIIVKRGKPGYFGDCLDICGKINGYEYFGDFGKGNYNKRKVYENQTFKVKNIVVKNIGLISKLDEYNDISKANNLGILNAENVKIINCKIEYAPQTNVGIVNDTFIGNTSNIIFNNCVFQNSGQHNVRVISYNNGDKIGNTVIFNNCQFRNVLGEDVVQKELSSYRVHLWYRGIGDYSENKVEINSCYFDETGFVYVNGNQNNITINKTTIESFLFVNSKVFDDNSNIKTEKSNFRKKGDFAEIFNKLKMYTITKDNKNLEETNFGIYSSINSNYKSKK